MHRHAQRFGALPGAFRARLTRAFHTLLALAVCGPLALAQGSDSCATPQVISGSAPSLTVAIDCSAATTGSEGQGLPTACSFGAVPGVERDVWYRFQAASNGFRRIKLCGLIGAGDSRVVIYQTSGCPTAATPVVACSDDEGCPGGVASQLAFPTQINQFYLIQIGNKPGTPAIVGAFEFTGLVAGDSSTSPIFLPFTPGDTAFSLTDALVLPGEATSCDMQQDVWFTWDNQLALSGLVVVETCGLTAVDTRMALSLGLFAPGPPITCNDDECGLQSRSELHVGSDQRLFVQLGTPAQVANATGTLRLSVQKPRLRISQVYTGGGEPGSIYRNDFVELYNAHDTTFDTAFQDPFSIQWTNDTSPGAWNVFAITNLAIVGHKYRVARGAAGALAADQGATFIADYDVPAMDLGPSGRVAIVHGTTPLVGNPVSDNTIIDLVGWGPTAASREPLFGGDASHNAVSTGVTESIYRLGCGDQDTNDNAADFRRGIAAPRSRIDAEMANSGVSALGVISPLHARPNTPVRLTAQPFDCATGQPIVTPVTYFNSTGSGVMHDDGMGGDEIAGDGIYSAIVQHPAPVGSATATERYRLRVGASGNQSVVPAVVRPLAPLNDNCSGATTMSATLPATVSQSLSEATVESNPTLALGSPPPGFVPQSDRRGLWYRVIGNGHTLTASTCASPLIAGAIPDTVLQVFGGTCDGLSWIAGNDDYSTLCGAGTGIERRSRVDWCTSVGESYYVWVSLLAPGAQTATIALTISDGPACSGALPVTTCLIPDAPGSVSENEATFGLDLNDGCARAPFISGVAAPMFPPQVIHGTARSFALDRDLDAFRFQAPHTGTLIATLEAQFRGRASIVHLGATGDCASITALSDTGLTNRCEQRATGALIQGGDWYAVVVEALNTGGADAIAGGTAPAAGSARYSLGLELPPPGHNDDCAGALTLALPSSRFGSTTGAALESALPSGCLGPGVAKSGGAIPVTAPGVWYRVVSPVAQTIDADVVSANFDAQISVYAGPCAALTCVTANDFVVAGSPSRARVAWPANAGQEYLILVHGLGGATGEFTLELSTAPTPANDTCANAFALAGASGTQVGTLVGATGEPSLLDSAGLASCAPPFTYWDVWYAWTPPCTGTASLATCGTWDTVLSVHASCPTPTASNELTAGACNDDGGGGCAPGSSLSFAATGGTTYFVRVATAGSQATAAGNGSAFTLTWSMSGLVDSDGDALPDCLDGCPANPALTAPTTHYPDLDADGFGAGAGALACGGPGLSSNNLDCDDASASIHPGAAEVCNGVDEDCDTSIDEGVATTFYRDADGDGFGSPANTIAACSAPLGYVSNSLDCNDTNGAIHPGAPEVCNEIDEDCDLSIDEGVSTTFYRDADGDGYGSPTSTTQACSAPSGYVTDASDCNDANAAVHPGAVEACDSVDNDCDTSVDEGFDADADGVPECSDNCPTIANAGQANSDGDAFGDACDNCPLVANASQADCDADQIGDACESDPDCNANQVPDPCDIASATSFDVDNNGVPDECQGIVAYCFGDGTTVACPCNNNGAAGNGCANSANPGGGHLSVVGVPSVSSDTLTLSSTSMTGSIAVFFQGATLTPPTIIDDGLGCVGGPIIRLGAKAVGGGGSFFPQPGDPLISVRGQIPPAGATRVYQTFYRNAVGVFCPPATSNRTNGLLVTWVP